MGRVYSATWGRKVLLLERLQPVACVSRTSFKLFFTEKQSHALTAPINQPYVHCCVSLAEKAERALYVVFIEIGTHHL